MTPIEREHPLSGGYRVSQTGYANPPSLGQDQRENERIWTGGARPSCPPPFDPSMGDVDVCNRVFHKLPTIQECQHYQLRL